MTKIKVVQPPCDYCDLKNMIRAAWAIRNEEGDFVRFMSLNNKGFFELNKGIAKIYSVEPKPKFCPMCGRKLDDEDKNELSND